MKVLITYYSRSGNTEKIAQKIAQGIEEAGGQVDLAAIKPVADSNIVFGAVAAVIGKNVKIKAKVTDCSNYDLVCFGSPVWVGHPTPVLNAYIDQCENIKDKHAAVFVTLGGGGGEGALQKVAKHLQNHGANVIARLDYQVGPGKKNLKNHKIQEAIDFGRDLVLQMQEL